MTLKEIQQLERSLPKPNPFTKWAARERLRRIKGGQFIGSEGLASSEPGFGGLLVKCYADEHMALPECVTNAALVRAHRYLMEPEPQDRNVALAYMLSLPASRAQSVLLRSLMLCEGMTYESLAKICGQDADVIGLYDSLFWNVMDRKEDSRYIGRLYLQSGPPELPDAQNDSEIDLLTLAFKTRRVDLVLTAAGVAPPDSEKLSVQARYQNIQRNYLVSALAALTSEEVCDAENPALKAVLRRMGKRTKQPPEHEQSPHISLVDAIQMTLDKIRGATRKSDQS